MSPKRLKDFDAAERVGRVKALTWALTVGLVFGGAAGGGVAELNGWNPLIGALVGAVAASCGMYFVTLTIAERSAAVAQTIYNPSGDSTPPKREYSYAESLAIRGRYREAADAYELHCAEDPSDPEPYFRLARLCRDKLGEHEKAVSWLKRVRTEARLDSGKDLLATQEIIEIYTHKLRDPRKAIPELARISTKFPGTAAAEAAARELTEMRELLALEQQQPASFTQEYLRRIDRRRDQT